ncbi:MAG TPA: hypothetical protein VLD57_09800 [Blastocatellia bacterium]|nr:hypothetical protein [Blastocatellia bacterium]
MNCRKAAWVLVCIVSFGSIYSLAAQAPGSPAAQIEEMKKISFLVGEWEGEGWTEMVPGQRRTSPIREVVQSKLGGLVLVVEGLGKRKDPGKSEETVTHNALGFLYYDEKAKLYRMKSFLADGRTVDAEAGFTDNGFQWWFKAQTVSIRYTVKLTEKGEWFETGEMSFDGKTWRQFHEMTLQRVK